MTCYAYSDKDAKDHRAINSVTEKKSCSMIKNQVVLLPDSINLKGVITLLFQKVKLDSMIKFFIFEFNTKTLYTI